MYILYVCLRKKVNTVCFIAIYSNIVDLAAIINYVYLWLNILLWYSIFIALSVLLLSFHRLKNGCLMKFLKENIGPTL